MKGYLGLSSTLLRGLIIRNTVFWGLYWGPIFWETTINRSARARSFIGFKHLSYYVGVWGLGFRLQGLGSRMLCAEITVQAVLTLLMSR